MCVCTLSRSWYERVIRCPACQAGLVLQGRTRLVLPGPAGAGEVDACTFLKITGCAHTVGQCRAPRWRGGAAGTRFAHASQGILARAAFRARAAVKASEARVADTRRGCSAPGR